MDLLDETLRRASMGRAQSAGGLNVMDLKQRLIRIFPNDRDVILRSKRQDLTPWTAQVLKMFDEQDRSRAAVISNNTNHHYSVQDMSYCRCLGHVAAKGTVKSIYGVCNESVGHTPGVRVSCTDYYKTGYHLPKEELEGLAKYKGKDPNEYAKELGYV